MRVPIPPGESEMRKGVNVPRGIICQRASERAMDGWMRGRRNIIFVHQGSFSPLFLLETSSKYVNDCSGGEFLIRTSH